MSYIEIRNLAKIYHVEGVPVNALVDFNLDIDEGEFVTLLGPSGCGKTTTLRCVVGLEKPDRGTIAIDDQTVVASHRGAFVPPNKRRIGMVFQSYSVWPHMTVAGNVAYPLQVRKVSKSEIRDRVNGALDLVHLQDLGARYPSQLSGGQQQQVALARALVAEPKVLLFDEPLSNLDAKLRDQMRHEILALRSRIKFTAIYVTHDQSEALTMSDRIVVMHHGLIQQIGSPRDIYEQPATHFVADFVGATNLVDATVVDRDPKGGLRAATAFGDLLVGASDNGLVPGDHAYLSIRPEALDVTSDDGVAGPNRWPGRVTQTSFAGATVDYWVQLGDVTLRAIADARRAPAAGARVVVSVDPAGVRALAED